MNKLHQAYALATIQLFCTRVSSIAIFPLFKLLLANVGKAFALALAMSLTAFNLHIHFTKSSINARSPLSPQFCMRQ